MPYDYEYTTTGNVKIQNVLLSFDKRNGKVSYEFDIEGKDWVSDSNYIEAKIRYSGADKATKTIYPTEYLTRQRIEWEAGTELNNANLGSQSVVLRIQDEDDTTQDFTHSETIDLDPNEYKLTLTNPPVFGDDSTPDITWTLKDLFSEQHMVPTITTGGSSSTALAVTLESGTTASGLSSGVVNLNGVLFSESSLEMDSTEAGRAYWSGITEYKITSPAMSAGDNTFTIELKCTTI